MIEPFYNEPNVDKQNKTQPLLVERKEYEVIAIFDIRRYQGLLYKVNTSETKERLLHPH